MLRQRRNLITQYEAANRHDLADVEKFEVTVLKTYLPVALSEDEVNAILNSMIAETGATSTNDMSKVMAAIKPKVVARADMGKIRINQVHACWMNLTAR